MALSDVSAQPTCSTRYVVGHSLDGTVPTCSTPLVPVAHTFADLEFVPTSQTLFMLEMRVAASIGRWLTRPGRRIHRPLVAGRSTRSRRTRSSSRGSPARSTDDPPGEPDLARSEALA